MKRNILIFFAIALFLALGCEKLPVGNAFLEKAPGVDVTKDTVFKNIEYAQRFLWGAYSTLRYGINTAQNGKPNIMSHDLLEDLTDLSQTYLSWGGAYTIYYTGQYMATTENSSHNVKYSYTLEDSWVAIRKAYIFLENIDGVPDGDAALKKQLKAEALMIIACQYADMFRYFGGLPWLDKSYGTQEEVPEMPRMTAQATSDSIVALCDRAAVNLPWTISDPANWDGRFTKAAAMGLKARILLFNASPIFNAATPYLDGAAATANNIWHGSYDANRWKKAADAAHDLIVQCEAGIDYKIYHLAGNTLRKDFQDAYYLRGNGEVLISTRVMFRAPNAGWTYTFYWSSNGWGAGCATDDYVKMFPMANGLPITDPASNYDPNYPFFNASGVPVRDPRLYETVKINGDYYQGRTVETWIGGRERQTQGGTAAATGYAVRKFELENNSTTTYGSIVHWPYLRLAEIYLSYAEADNEFNNGPSPEGYRCVNIIRNRVGLGNLPAGLTRDQFREAVLLERALEFGWEEVRWFDLVRWVRANDFTKTLHGMNLFRSTNTPYTYTYTQFNLPLRYWAQTWSPKWYLAAFPQNEVNKGYGLLQNPGW
jgi:hypothetical protein